MMMIEDCDGSGWLRLSPFRPGGPYKCDGCRACLIHTPSELTRKMARAQEIAAHNKRMQKLHPTGDASRDTLVAARLNLQRPSDKD